jgi:hypothetical protein
MNGRRATDIDRLAAPIPTPRLGGVVKGRLQIADA